MKIIDNIEINNKAIIDNIKKLINQIYRLLPIREEILDWETPLGTIIEELSGMDSLLLQYHSLFFPLLCKLEGLYQLKEEEQFKTYRRTIFECLNILSSIKGEIEKCQD